MELTAAVRDRITQDHVVWLTTVADSGTPTPNPVWCALDGEDVVAFTSAAAVRLHNIAQRPLVSLNFNSDELGGDVVVITGTATVRPGRPSEVANYREKYESAMRELHQMTLEQFDSTFDHEIRVRPLTVRSG